MCLCVCPGCERMRLPIEQSRTAESDSATRRLSEYKDAGGHVFTNGVKQQQLLTTVCLSLLNPTFVMSVNLTGSHFSITKVWLIVQSEIQTM